MSIINHFVSEMRIAKFSQADIDVLQRAMEKFLEHYDSGGSVWAMSNYLQQLKTYDNKEGEIGEVIDILRKRFNTDKSMKDAIEIFVRGLAFAPLTPLTGEDDEWIEVGTGVYQNTRMATVFKDPRFHDGKKAFDLENPEGARAAISFPYMRKQVSVSSPEMIFETESA